MHLELRTPEAVFFDAEARSVTLPGTMGRFQVLRRHAPLLSTLQKGLLVCQTEKESLYFHIGTGLAEVRNNRLRVLVESVTQAQPAGK